MAEGKLTVLAAWQLHLKCCEAIAADDRTSHIRALCAVRDALGAELTRILTPTEPEETEPGE